MKKIGLACIALALAISGILGMDIGEINIIPGLLHGAGIGLLLAGMLPERARGKIRRVKMSFFHR
ncbi:MAG: hypothetical protein LBK23_01725 [Oscillospiraceae bacterium]|jgi:hypothetical protein|nr:hypothetical protein [Oscillospiraceae bacterium]